ncbi:QueT transporter family protein [Staphylococcus aureus]|uniref:QueT transporter family protein n=1 Tax=Staphylococcus aureus TaxID=1280 RepID=UPI003D9249AE
MTSKDITQISVIAAILTILAVLKIPSIIPGLDFQLSAPAALLILAFFGIKKYFLGGLLSSLLLLVFGVFNPINVIISIIFRVIAIAVVYLLKINVLSLVLASVLGSLVLSIILNLPVWVVLLNAIPGVIFTLIVAIPLYLTLRKRMAVLLR